MVFHPSKCKELSISKKNIFDNLPFNVFLYEMNGALIDYVDTQRDLTFQKWVLRVQIRTR